jgi:hypothetical protein
VTGDQRSGGACRRRSPEANEEIDVPRSGSSEPVPSKLTGRPVSGSAGENPNNACGGAWTVTVLLVVAAWPSRSTTVSVTAYAPAAA